VDTGFAGWPAEVAEQARQDGHIGRLVEPEDVAAVALFLVTGGSALTGAEIVVDGGIISLGARG
jgi:NAD(P)-dependent dehydrogenase (short-subunit alcohol dehydrogenase family)